MAERRQLLPFSQVGFDAIHNNEALTIDFMRQFLGYSDPMIPIAIDGQTAVTILKAASRLQQSEIEFVFLAAQLPRAPATNSFQRRTPPERSAGLRQLPTCK